MSNDLARFLGNELANVRKFQGAQFLDTVSPYSKIRCVFDLTPGASGATPVFSGTVHTDAMKDLQAFSYAYGESAALAGYGSTTSATRRHTNLTQKRKIPGNGRGRVLGFSVSPDGFVKKPKTTTDSNTISNDSDDTEYYTQDSLAGGLLHNIMLRLFNDCYAPYVQFGTSSKVYLGKSAWLGNGTHIADASQASILGDVLLFPEGFDWENAGDDSEMIVGFELLKKPNNPAWVSDTDSPWVDIMTALNVAATGSQPAAKTAMGILDFTIRAFVAKTSVRRGG